MKTGQWFAIVVSLALVNGSAVGAESAVRGGQEEAKVSGLKAEIARKSSVLKGAKAASEELARAKTSEASATTELELHLSSREKGRGAQLAACPEESSCKGAGSEFYKRAELLRAKLEVAKAIRVLGEGKLLLASERVRLELDGR